MTGLNGRRPTAAAARAADVLLRALGGFAVMLRMPANAIALADAEQLGLSTPQFQDIAMGPAVYRKMMPQESEGRGTRAELLVSATTVLGAVGSLGYASAQVLFAEARGVVVNGTLMQITGMSSSEVLGQPYLYRLQLRGTLSEIA